MHTVIDIPDVESHPVKTIYSEVSEAFQQEAGWDIDLLSLLESPEACPDGTGITLEMSDLPGDVIRNHNLPFSVEKELDDHFAEESTGSGNVTSLKIEMGLSIRDVIGKFVTYGQLEEAVELVEGARNENDPSARTIVAYAVAQYAKGWMAEQFVADHVDAAKKGTVAQDDGGIDFWWDGEQAQLGSITRLNSKKSDLENSDKRQLLYQWDHRGTLHVADYDEIIDINKEISEDAGVPHTLTSRSHNGLAICRELGTEENARYIRYLWW